jgi:anti-sigma factor RsiW
MKDLVHAYLDDELSLTEQLSFEQHVATCPACEQAHRTFAQLRQQMKSSALSYELPSELNARLKQSLPTRRIRFSRALLAAASVLLAIGLGALLIMRSSGGDLAQVVVDAHVRSLQANHLLDVISTDQHTVKPWFDGKLDFAPPVRDLAGEGFPLVGGRLDYLQDHTVAAMVYQRGKHPINLFAWPESGADESIASSAVHGYNVVQWRQNQMREVAVSDLNLQELQQFADLLRQPFR